MKLLLDTHTLIWHTEGNHQISPSAAASLADPGNDLFLSAATLWEMAIKLGLGKLTLSQSLGDYLAAAIAAFRLSVIPISVESCDLYAALPFPNSSHIVEDLMRQQRESGRTYITLPRRVPEAVPAPPAVSGAEPPPATNPPRKQGQAPPAVSSVDQPLGDQSLPPAPPAR